MSSLTGHTRFRTEISEVNFKELISESLLAFRQMEFAHRLEVKTTIEGCLPFYSDRKHLQIIFNNLISNAIRFQHPHEAFPVLQVLIEVDGEKARLTFKDNGIGIPAEATERVFDMFYRSPGTSGDGAGLGLYMVKEIVKKLKGKIKIASSVNEGACFNLELPNRIDPDLLRKLNKLIQNTK